MIGIIDFKKLTDEESPLTLIEPTHSWGCRTAAERTNILPFSLEKTSEVLQYTSHLDRLGRGERDWVNDGLGNSKCK